MARHEIHVESHLKFMKCEASFQDHQQSAVIVFFMNHIFMSILINWLHFLPCAYSRSQNAQPQSCTVESWWWDTKGLLQGRSPAILYANTHITQRYVSFLKVGLCCVCTHAIDLKSHKVSEVVIFLKGSWIRIVFWWWIKHLCDKRSLPKAQYLIFRRRQLFLNNKNSNEPYVCYHHSTRWHTDNISC